MKKLTAVTAIALILCIFLSCSVFAEPTDSFTHIEKENGTFVSVPSREMYRATKVLRASTFGLEKALSGINDLFVDENENVYILVSGRSSIVVLNPDYTYQRTIKLIDEDGVEVGFNNAMGIFVEKGTGDIYVCDADNRMIIIADKQGKVKDYMHAPESSLMPENYDYRPTKLIKDDKGYMYIISEGDAYYGAVSYDPDGKFLGFYGANTVKATALDTLAFLWDKITQTDTKKSYSVKTIPSAFVDFALDSEGYIVTCTCCTSPDSNEIDTGQIRKLSPGGADILYKRNTDGTSAASNAFNFLESKVVKEGNHYSNQDLIAIDTDANDFIYALDQTFGLIYVYDSECNMLGGFGGMQRGAAMQMGTFTKPVSIAVKGEDVLVADREALSVTVFEPTDYGRTLKLAQAAYVIGDYEGSKELWQKVLDYDSNNQLAYRGLAMAALTEEDYETALKYAKIGLDYTVYDLAWQRVLSNRISKYFVIIFPVALALLGGIIAFFVIMKKKNKKVITNVKLKLALGSSVHPFGSFGEIKYKKLGSVKIAIVLMVLFYIGKMLQKIASGFLFTTTARADYNMLYTVLGTVGLVLLWSVANWLVACLTDGKGTFKEVFVFTSYALIPYIIFTYVSVIASHFIPLSAAPVLSGISVVVLLYTFFLLAIAIMEAHEYDFFKFLTTGIVSVFFMLLIVFMVFLIGTLSQQILDFFKGCYTEMVFRQ